MYAKEKKSVYWPSTISGFSMHLGSTRANREQFADNFCKNQLISDFSKQ